MSSSWRTEWNKKRKKSVPTEGKGEKRVGVDRVGCVRDRPWG